MTEHTNETAVLNSSSGPKAPPGFETEVLPNNTEWCKKVEDDNAFLRQQRAAMQNSMDLLLSRMSQQTLEEPYIPQRDSNAWIVDSSTVYVSHVSHSPFQQYYQQMPQFGRSTHSAGGYPARQTTLQLTGGVPVSNPQQYNYGSAGASLLVPHNCSQA